MSTKRKSGASSTFNATGDGFVSQIPNLFTLLNLIFGCIAIVFVLQTGETLVVMDNGEVSPMVLPEKIWWGALFIFGAALIDFLDGFLARLLGASSEMGKQLDSLSDVVSFGVAPGMILYQLLRISYAREPDGLDVPFAALLPAFIFSGAVAWRLAKFNIATDQSYGFKGVPSPAAGLVVASLPLIIFYEYFGFQNFFINHWVLYAIIVLLSYLMVSNHDFMAIKFTDYSFRNNWVKYILLAVAVIGAIALGWLAVPVVFVIYLVLSQFSRQPDAVTRNKETIDITV